VGKGICIVNKQKTLTTKERVRKGKTSNVGEPKKKRSDVRSRERKNTRVTAEGRGRKGDMMGKVGPREKRTHLFRLTGVGGKKRQKMEKRESSF